MVPQVSVPPDGAVTSLFTSESLQYDMDYFFTSVFFCNGSLGFKVCYYFVALWQFLPIVCNMALA